MNKYPRAKTAAEALPPEAEKLAQAMLDIITTASSAAIGLRAAEVTMASILGSLERSGTEDVAEIAFHNIREFVRLGHDQHEWEKDNA